MFYRLLVHSLTFMRRWLLIQVRCRAFLRWDQVGALVVQQTVVYGYATAHCWVACFQSVSLVYVRPQDFLEPVFRRRFWPFQFLGCDQWTLHGPHPRLRQISVVAIGIGKSLWVRNTHEILIPPIIIGRCQCAPGPKLALQWSGSCQRRIFLHNLRLGVIFWGDIEVINDVYVADNVAIDLSFLLLVRVSIV